MPWLAKPTSPQEADSYPRLRQGQQVLLIGDTLSVRIIHNNLTGQNFQPRETAAGDVVSWRTLQETSEEYRNYLRYMEEDLGVAINPDCLSIEIIEEEESHV